jgi:hypothetical protein
VGTFSSERTPKSKGLYHWGMRTLAEGKEAVLHYLENEALGRTNEQSGVYMLQRDDAGNLVLHFAGFTFIGSGTVSIGGNLLDVTDGLVIKFQKPS